MNKYYQKFRNRCFDILGHHCVLCGSGERLEMDHVDPSTKTMKITGKYQSPKWWPLVLEELKKCQTLCHDCHKKKSDQEAKVERGFTHGTLYAWMKKQCDCIVCFKAKLEYRQLKNLKRRIGAVAELV